MKVVAFNRNPNPKNSENFHGSRVEPRAMGHY